MPYIKDEDRERIEKTKTAFPITEELAGRIESCGELNYVITRLLDECIQNWGESYQTYDEIIGAIECAKLELYRRKIALYEDIKVEENGDVFLW